VKAREVRNDVVQALALVLLWSIFAWAMR